MNAFRWMGFATKLLNAFTAGLLGTTLNTLVLQLAPPLHINAGKGGLLQLFHWEVARRLRSLLPFVSRLGLKQPPPWLDFCGFTT